MFPSDLNPVSKNYSSPMDSFFERDSEQLFWSGLSDTTNISSHIEWLHLLLDWYACIHSIPTISLIPTEVYMYIYKKSGGNYTIETFKFAHDWK